MEKHTQIIEFYGLPGCGKSTLLESLVSDTGQTVSFCTLHDVGNQFKRASLGAKLGSVPVACWWYTLCYICSVPRIPLRKWKLYRSFFYISMLYRFAGKKASSFDYLVVDHGMYQAAISVLYGHAETLSETSWKWLKKSVSKLDVDYLVYCNISVATSVSRIRARGRKNNGRLDMLTSDEELKSVLNKQQALFAHEYDLLPDQSYSLDMEPEPQIVYNQMQSILVKDAE